ncbi:alpha/beta fold hydrolase [Alcaligenes sp. SDU_A2]|uniref:alpha/beta fold hydrolase n=1 Tax=Alcaligenes sp. SDU_A2 TaxID=3136634 RepID=UPI00311FDC94
MCASASGTHRMAYWEWGDPDNDQVVMCVHGLTRTGRDFDHLAQPLAARYRVIAPDVVGRGRSDWLVDPAAYAIPQYVADMLVLLARLRPARLDWVGTSMGGLIALGLHGAQAMSALLRPARPGPALDAPMELPLGRVVLNDVGPALNLSGLQRISDYVGQAVIFDTFAQAVDYVRSVSAPFGDHSLADWQDISRHVFVEHDGKWQRHYDLRLSQAFARQADVDLDAAQALLWGAYESLPESVLILRGEHSDLLSVQAAHEMLRRNPHAQLVEVANVGHAPMLRSADQIDHIDHFLAG